MTPPRLSAALRVHGAAQALQRREPGVGHAGAGCTAQVLNRKFQYNYFLEVRLYII